MNTQTQQDLEQILVQLLAQRLVDLEDLEPTLALVAGSLALETPLFLATLLETLEPVGLVGII